MKIDLNTYKASRVLAENWYKKRPNMKLRTAIATVATMLSVPVIVVAFWFGEMNNWPSESISTIESYIKFYKYTKILNKPENSPINI